MIQTRPQRPLDLLAGMWKRFPEGTTKNLMRRVRDVVRKQTPAKLDYATPIVEELNKLEIVSTGEDEGGTPFLSLRDGTVLFGVGLNASDAERYGHLPQSVKERIPVHCIRLAHDVVCHYVYPHAMPYLTPPYPREERRGFQPQHWDTIDDITTLADGERAMLRERFTLRDQDVVLDVGAYLGMGALRVSREVGPKGLVVSVEATEENRVIYRKNRDANGTHNMRLIECGVWKERSMLSLNCAGTHYNSFVEGIVDAQSRMTIPTDSIDNIVQACGLDRLSLVSLTINGAEVEAVEGMDDTLRRLAPNLSIAGWYQRDGVAIWKIVTDRLRDYGYLTTVGPYGRVYGWKP